MSNVLWKGLRLYMNTESSYLKIPFFLWNFYLISGKERELMNYSGKYINFWLCLQYVILNLFFKVQKTVLLHIIVIKQQIHLRKNTFFTQNRVVTENSHIGGDEDEA